MKNHTDGQITETQSPSLPAMLSKRSEALATRLENGAKALGAFAAALSEAEWQTRLPKDGRKVGVIVHHVASMYPIEIQLASLLAAGQPITGVTWDAVDTINREHAKENDKVAKDAALALLKSNSAAAAAAIRAFSEEELDRACVAQQRRSTQLPILRGGSSGAAQLPPPCSDQSGTGALGAGRKGRLGGSR